MDKDSDKLVCNGDKVSNRLYFAMGTRLLIDYILQWGQGFKYTIFRNAYKVSNRLYFAMGKRFQIDCILQWGQGFI